ncbi:DeoR-like protein with HTH domain [Labedaea rhizosphaerae]|uniref:DeoR-like protein with HTH domain n=2 Tax=Labedaea rhizosphaerae TaxID=598644 RepID=A0A4R6SHK1_LABRH|nr:DeoR-like protein with HTH domain [Labedaea rhizosphaerae]
MLGCTTVSRMFAAERRQVILELVRTTGAVSLRELAAIVKTSEVTVRRDLRFLEQEGLLARRHGGAVATDRPSYEPTYTEKTHVRARRRPPSRAWPRPSCGPATPW